MLKTLYIAFVFGCFGWLACYYHGPAKTPQKPRDIRVADVTMPFLIDDIQAWLVAQGQAIEVDGRFGPQTEAALEDVYCTMSAERWEK